MDKNLEKLKEIVKQTGRHMRIYTAEEFHLNTYWPWDFTVNPQTNVTFKIILHNNEGLALRIIKDMKEQVHVIYTLRVQNMFKAAVGHCNAYISQEKQPSSMINLPTLDGKHRKADNA